MHHAITVGGLLCSLGIVVGLVLVALGALIVFATGMSDNPSDANPTPGCICGVVGIVLLVASIWGLF